MSDSDLATALRTAADRAYLEAVTFNGATWVDPTAGTFELTDTDGLPLTDVLGRFTWHVYRGWAPVDTAEDAFGWALQRIGLDCYGMLAIETAAGGRAVCRWSDHGADGVTSDPSAAWPTV